MSVLIIPRSVISVPLRSPKKQKNVFIDKPGYAAMPNNLPKTVF
jgi:hypothetical protein